MADKQNQRKVALQTKSSVRWERHFGPALQLARVKARMPQAVVIKEARRRGIEIMQSWLSRVEHGKINLDVRRLVTLCEIYSIPLESIISIARQLEEASRLDADVLRDGIVSKINDKPPRETSPFMYSASSDCGSGDELFVSNNM